MIVRRFLRQVNKYPAHCAVKAGDKEITYLELHHLTDTIAAHITAINSGPTAGSREKTTALLFQHGIDMISGLLSTLKASRIYVPFDPSYPEKRLAYMLKDSGAPLLITNNTNLPMAQKLAEQTPHHVEILNIDTLPHTETTAPPAETHPGAEPDQVAYLLYTSGSTGQPKGVVQTHRNILHYIDCYRRQLSLTAADRLTLLSAFSHDAAVMDIYSALLSGATLYPLNIKETDITEMADWLNREKITIWHSVPTVYRYMVNTLSGEENFPHLRFVVLGGEAVLPEDIFRFQKHFTGAAFMNLYGQSEASFNAAMTVSPGEPVDKVVLGAPIDEVDLMVVDDEGEEVKPFQEGEIVVINNYASPGYWKDPEKTEAVFDDDPELGRLYWTGDRGRLLLDGSIEFAGRADFQVKVRGYRVELEEIETVLVQHPAIKQTAVVALEQPDGQTYLCAYVAPEAGESIDVPGLREFLAQELMEHMLPSHFMELEQLPVTPTGKTDRKALPSLEGRMLTGAEYAAPSNGVEEQLVETWKEVLALENVGIDDNFFDSGGHSLNAIVLSAHIHRRLNVECPLKEIFRTPTIRGLARFIMGAEKADYTAVTPAPQQDHYPLSSAQKRMFILHQLEGPETAAAYNISAAVEIYGTLDHQRLETAFRQLVHRHEALRTSFKTVDNLPVQVIHPPGEVPGEIRFYTGEDLPSTPTLSRPFDLSRPPLIRIAFFSHPSPLSPLPSLHIDMHHIISDGVSAGLITRELIHLYNGEELPAPRLQYKDFALWQEGLFQSGVMKRQAEFWKKQLGGELPVLELPTDFPRPEVQEFEGRTVTFNLDESLTGRLNQVAAGCGATPYMVLLGLYNVLLSMYTRAEDIITGTPTAGRPHADLQHIVGMFVNTLAIRNYPAGELPFTTFLETVKEEVLEAFQNQDYPFEELVEQLDIRRDLGRNPLFDTVFALQNMDDSVLEVEGMTFKSLDLETGIAKFDLLLTLWESNGGLQGNFQYATALFKQETVQRMAQHFTRIIRQIAGNPGIRLNQLHMLTDREKQQLLVEFNDTHSDFQRSKTIHGLFTAQVRRTPGNVALSGPSIAGDNLSLTYGELDRRAEKTGFLLAQKGAVPETIVGILAERTVEMVIGILGILKAGAAYLPIDPGYPADRTAFMLRDSAAPFLLTHRTTAKENHSPADWEGETIFMETAADFVPAPIPYQRWKQGAMPDSGPANSAYVIYTSGTTGKPKGVVVEHLNVVRLMVNDHFPFTFGPGDVWTIFHSFCFDFSVWEMYGPLLYGGRAVVIPSMIARDPAAFLDLLEEEKVTVLNQTPSAFYLLAREAVTQPARNPRLRYVIFGAEALKPVLLKEWKERFPETQLVNMYGITETTVHVTYKEITAAEIASNSPGIGVPVPTLSTFIMDRWQRLLPLGAAGELCVGGDGVARGYLNRPDLTAEKFVPNPYNLEAAPRLYRSGDLARMMEQGEMDYLGRIDQQVKIRGFRIELGEIENRIAQSPAVKETVVLAKKGKDAHQQELFLCAYVVPAGPDPESAHLVPQLREFLAQALPSYMVPAHFMVIHEMPLTPNGKVDRKALPEPRAVSSRTYQPPVTLPQEKLVRAWAHVLGMDESRIGIHDDFFEIGGHSLKATLLAALVKKDLEMTIPLKEIFRNPTVRGMAEYIESTETPPHPIHQPIPRAEIQPHYPLSPAQERLYTLRQLESTGPGTAYNITTAVQLTGNPHLQRLEKAFQTLIQRHESLRTSFEAIDGAPQQIIHDSVQFAFARPPAGGAYCTARADATAAGGGSVLELNSTPKGFGDPPAGGAYCTDPRKAFDYTPLLRDFIQPFDLSRAPLLRASLTQTDENTYLLMMDMHHIISDGASMGILVRELIAAYREKDLPQLPLQYKDYAVWQRETAQTGTLRLQEEYWKKLFEGEIPTLELPTDFPRPALQRFEGRSFDITLEPRLTSQVKAVAAANGATPYMVLLALFNVLLSRYSRAVDIVIGTPVAGRTHPDLENIVGMFVNTLAMRNFPKGELSFTHFLRDLKERALEAFDNQDYPFEALVETLDLRRDVSRGPLFDTMFSLQNLDVEAAEPEDFRVKPLDFENPVSKFDLTLTGAEVGEEFRFTFQYALSLFNGRTVRRMAGHWKNLLQRAVLSPGLPLDDIDMLVEEERLQVLEVFNGTRWEYPREKTVVELFEQQARRAPDSIAAAGPGMLPGGEVQLSYGEVIRRVRELAHVLVEKGLEPGSAGAVMMPQEAEMIIAILGILKTGAAYLPIDPRYPVDRVTYLLADSSARVFLTTRAAGEDIAAETETLYLEDLHTVEPPSGVRDPLPSAAPSDPVYIIYTSGSTGKPKGVVVGHQSLVNMCSWYTEYFETVPSDRMSKYVGFGFDVSLWEIFPCLLTGARLVIVPDELRVDMGGLNGYFEQQGVTVSFLPAQVCEQFMAAGDNRSLRILQSGGDKLKEYTQRSYRLYNNYGPTEYSVVTTSCPVLTPHVNIPIGKPVFNTYLYVLDANLRLQPVGVPGELCIAGDGIAQGYLNRPGLTHDAFISNPFAPRKLEQELNQTGEPTASLPSKLYKTGDLVSWLPDGQLQFLGRLDFQVKIRGFRIELGEIETVLGGHDAVAAAAVAARPDEDGQTNLCAYVVFGDGAGEAREEIVRLREYLARSLPDYMVPAYFVPMEELPLNASGKVDRRALPEPGVSTVSGEEYRAPRDETERILAEIFCEVLNLERAGLEDNFFRLGGHSLKATLVTSRIHKQLGVQLPLAELFKSPTVRALARAVKETSEAPDAGSFEAIVPAPAQEYYPLSSVQRRMYMAQVTSPSNRSYNLPVVVELQGVLDFEFFEETLRRLVYRHESFRTAFEVVDAEPRQKVLENVPFSVEFHEPGGGGEQQGLRVREILEAFVQPFDLAEPPLFRAALIKVEAHRHILMMDMHHIISDGTSFNVMLAEFLRLYLGESLEPMRLQYKDFVVWQESEARKRAIKSQENYWLEQFRKDAPLLQLPTDNPRPKVKSFEGRHHHFELDEEIARGLTRIAAGEEGTLFMVLLALYNVFLSRLCGQEDIVVGTSIAGRRHIDLQPIVGMFVNALPLRNYPRGGRTFREFLAELRRSTLDAFENQDYPFDQLVEFVGGPRDTSRNPLFDTMFVLNNEEELDTFRIPGLVIQPCAEFQHTTAQMDIKFRVREIEERLYLSFEYSTVLFSAGTMEMFENNFREVVSAVLGDVDICLGDIGISHGLVAVEDDLSSVDFAF